MAKIGLFAGNTPKKGFFGLFGPFGPPGPGPPQGFYINPSRRPPAVPAGVPGVPPGRGSPQGGGGSPFLPKGGRPPLGGRRSRVSVKRIKVYHGAAVFLKTMKSDNVYLPYTLTHPQGRGGLERLHASWRLWAPGPPGTAGPRREGLM